jgi:hypothetical protein
VNLNHLTAAAAIALLSLAGCQKGTAAVESPASSKPGTERIAPAQSSDMLASAELFVSEQGRDWTAYSALPQIKWVDPSPKEYAPGRYSQHGKILLLGFSVKEVPNGRPGPDYATTKRNEGESTLSINGSQAAVESISISKPFYSDDYLDVLKNQFGTAAEVSTIADGCPPGEGEEDARNGAFYAISLAGGDKIYLQASQQDGGKYTAGFTVFTLTRTQPSGAMTLGCKPVTDTQI